MLTVTPSSEEGYSLYGESIRVGDLDGIYASARIPEVGVSNPNSAAGTAGFKTGDVITELNGTALKTWEDFLTDLLKRRQKGSNFHFKVDRSSATVQMDLTKTWMLNHLKRLGVFIPPKCLSRKRFRNLRLDHAGFCNLAIASSVFRDRTVESFFDLKDEVQKAGEKEGKVQIED